MGELGMLSPAVLAGMFPVSVHLAAGVRNDVGQ